MLNGIDQLFIQSKGEIMKLYLVRHATQKPKEEDPEKSLSDMGRQEIETSSSFAAGHGMNGIHKIYHSGKKRAEQTAEILAKHVKPEAGVEATDGLAPLDSPSIWVKRLGSNKYDGDIALVGHLPYMAKLASQLLCDNPEGGFIEFQAAAIACLEKDDEGKWALEWVISPDML
jgi:phosphohistidine phosphatase